MTVDSRPGATPVRLQTPRLALEPLAVEHAEEMAGVLADHELYRFTGGVAPTVAELRERYRRQTRGHSPDGHERWCTWIVRRREDGRAVGFVQATVTVSDGVATAALAWTIGTDDQRRGYALEAAERMAGWLTETGITRLTACIHPDHQASMAIARGLGLSPTPRRSGGEVVWRS